MDDAKLANIIQRLYAERQRIDDTIKAVEMIAADEHTPKRGRPPKWLTAAKANAEKSNYPKRESLA